MFTRFYTYTVNAYMLLQNLSEYVKKLEHGDSDSSGSTLRTMGIVLLVVAVVLIIGIAVLAASHLIANNISSTTFGTFHS